MNEDMFVELEASLKEGLEILRGEAGPSRVFELDAADVGEIFSDQPSDFSDKP